EPGHRLEGALKGAAAGAAIGGGAGAVLAGGRAALARAEMNKYAAEGLDTAAFRAKNFYDQIGNTVIKTNLGEAYTIADIERMGRELGVWTDDIKLFELAGDYTPYSASRFNQARKDFEHGI